MNAPSLPKDMPDLVVHYSWGVPFRSMMELDALARRTILDTGTVANPGRYEDPDYVGTRLRIEAQMFDLFEAAGGQPRIRHPHYALIGRSARAESKARPEGAAGYALPLSHLPVQQTTFTRDDSFHFDPAFRRTCGRHHPGSARLYRLEQLPEVLERWAHTTERPPWHCIEVQLWYTPQPGEYERITTPID